MSDTREERRRKRLERFRETTRDRVWRINLSWIQYEQGQSDGASSAEILRELHTLKGEASLMGFSGAAEMAHAIEDAVQASRVSGVVHGDLGDHVLQGLDSIAELVANEPSETIAADTQQKIDELRRRARGDDGAGDAEKASAPDPRELAKLAAPPTGYAVRVTREQLDQIRDIIGELLLTRTRLTVTASSLRHHRDTGVNGSGREIRDALGEVETSLRDDVLRMGNLVTALEDITRELRMVPIGVLFEQFPRAARDLARELGKKVQVAYEGQAVELDREVLEALSEPLLHLVRNAVDHGIELPETRVQAGKSDVGTLRLRARMAGSMLDVEVADDGIGVDRARVRELALERGLLDGGSERALTDEDVLRCLIAPGLSTRAAVTRVSGRGVGLDVVQQTVRMLGGSMSLSTEPGYGTTFKLSVPISVAITSVVLFRVGAGRYALPAASVVALVEAESLRHVDSLGGRSLHYGGSLIPLIDLCPVLEEPPAQLDRDRAARIMIVGTGSRLLALSGGHGHLQRDVVLKTAGKLLSQRRLVSAGVALEDGSVALVLSPPTILQLARGRVAVPQPARASAPQLGAITVLVVDDSPIVLDLIAETLRSHGLRVFEAVDGEQAMQTLLEHPEIDMLVTDIEMPNMDGLQLIAQLRERNQRRIPAIVVSTRGSDDDKKAAMQVGADAYLVKSDFSRDSLWSLVSRFVG